MNTCDDSLSFTELLSDTSISTDGEYLFKGKRITPFGDNYNDETGIYLAKHHKKKVEILLFNRKKYVGKVLLKDTELSKEIKVRKGDMQKVFPPGMYKIYILENEIPILKYNLFLLY
jgi:hypothetical protein